MQGQCISRGNGNTALRADHRAGRADGSLPDLAVPADKLGDDRKIAFHKPGVTVEQARADLSFCWRFLPHGVSRQAPGFVPWRKADVDRPVSYDGGAYGLVGIAD